MKNNWNKAELKNWFISELQGNIDVSEVEDIFFRIIESLGIAKLDWVLMDGIEIEEDYWRAIINDLQKDRPIQYILGYEYFVSEKYIINQHVLIPRPETEELIAWILAENKIAAPCILDIGTGSGCISISLKKKLPDAQITATDISHEALAIADKNSQRLQAPVKFVQDDILNTTLAHEIFDIIVSNPPYIPQEEAINIANRVKNYEPHMALFTQEKEPLQFYEAIMFFAKKSMKPAGYLYFEVHEDYAFDVCKKAQQLGYNASSRMDIYGKPRMIQLKNDV